MAKIDKHIHANEKHGEPSGRLKRKEAIKSREKKGVSTVSAAIPQQTRMFWTHPFSLVLSPLYQNPRKNQELQGSYATELAILSILCFAPGGFCTACGAEQVAEPILGGIQMETVVIENLSSEGERKVMKEIAGNADEAEAFRNGENVVIRIRQGQENLRIGIALTLGAGFYLKQTEPDVFTCR